MLCFFQLLFTVQQARVSCALYVRKAASRHNSLLQKLKCHAVLLGIQAWGSNTKDFRVFGCQSKTVQRIQKEWEEFNDDYPVHIMVTLYLCSFSHMTSDSTQRPTCLKVLVLIWIERWVAWRPYVWQQDSMPYHTSRKSLCWLHGIH